MFRSLSDVEKSCLSEDAKEQIRNALKAKNDNRVTNPAPNVEQSFVCKPLGTKENPRFTNPVRIVVCSTRKRETDFRAISEKAVIDALVKNHILADDRKRKNIVSLIVEEPEISNDEKTVIVIEEI